MHYSIGQLAALTGLPVKTIRFYSDEGVLPAPDRTPSGYRRYTEEHRAHLELVRTLREIGLDLATIRSLGRRRLKDVLALHLKVVETQISALQRTRAVLRATLDNDDPAEEDLRRLHALGRVGKAEMAGLLDAFIDEVGGDVAARREWLACMRDAMLPDLPEEPTSAQLDAWLELAGLLADPDFQESLRTMSEDFWARPREDLDAWRRTSAALLDEVGAALTAGIAPDSPEAAPVLERVLELAGQSGEEMLRGFDEHDPRSERLWELVAIVRGMEQPWPQTAAYRWIEQALRADVTAH
ncbi:MerR family transcriptional regulator [Nonomuraea turcica]|uniref:MerR family transcriptional regulator n=1 Tax=Nonomuraea sp. G32 TaxID=3067274 RepID=UPI00273AEFEA|nr:MerR family transcriptional regulator [Nonomuraea sp. G32]MDP4508157.1 MerR family transcriptional regulator [Nonomuraea sp. G32]